MATLGDAPGVNLHGAGAVVAGYVAGLVAEHGATMRLYINAVKRQKLDW